MSDLLQNYVIDSPDIESDNPYDVAGASYVVNVLPDTKVAVYTCTHSQVTMTVPINGDATWPQVDLECEG